MEQDRYQYTIAGKLITRYKIKAIRRMAFIFGIYTIFFIVLILIDQNTRLYKNHCYVLVVNGLRQSATAE